MPQSGVFLTAADMEQLADFFLGLWYTATIEGRTLTENNITLLRRYSQFFGGGDIDDTRAEMDETWPRYRNIPYSDDVEFIARGI